MAERAIFTGFDPYKLTGVRVTDRELGHGSYATVLELEYMGLKCAGKKIHELLLRQGDASYTVSRFEEECRLLSQIRHPNIVQFLGVYFQQGVRAPILVMEFLPTNLTSCIEQYGILPKEINYSILHDVALGLCYLHGQTPAIIHRDLSSNNVLLTPNMTAKISDLGVARILNLTPLQVSRMTQTPGTPAYMPPEVMIANPKYNTSVDEFSYGIMMIHMFSGRWPEPQVGQIRNEAGRMIPVSEAERRDIFLQAIEQDHPLMDIILKCISNEPKDRMCAREFYNHISALTEQFPASFINRLDLFKKIAAQEEEKNILKEESQQKQTIIDVQSLEIKHLQLQVRQSDSQNQLVRAESEAKISELKTKATLDEDRIMNLLQEKKQLEQDLTLERDQLENELTQKRALTTENSSLLSKISDLQHENTALKHDIGARDNSIYRKDAVIKSKQTDLEAKIRALSDKDAIISEMSEELTKAKEYLMDKQQILLSSFTWKECAKIPTRLSILARTTTINGKVYFGGIESSASDTEYTVYCYDPLQDRWTTLPPLPIRHFGLGQVDGKLVAIGGVMKIGSFSFESDVVYTFDEQTKVWRQTIPPMPTGRWSPGVLSLQSALVVAGGAIYTLALREPSLVDILKFPFSRHSNIGDLQQTEFSDIVEIFQSDTLQWYKASPLPIPCQAVSMIAIGNTCFALGGYKQPSCHNKALYALIIDDLLCNQTAHSGSSDTQSAWKTLPNTPTYRPVAAELAGNLLAIDTKLSNTREIYMHISPTDSWNYIGALPFQEINYLNITVANLSPLEILVVEGRSVYKGTPFRF